MNQMSDSRSRTSGTGVVVGAVVGVLLVVLGLVLVQQLTSSDDAAPAAGGSAGTVELPPPGECNEPPAPPEQPQQYDAAPDPATAEGATWTARVATSCGEIVMELDGDQAPQTVASFLFLAREGFWDDSPCHRLTTDADGIFVLQCGDPTGSGSGGPGYGYGVENAPGDGDYPRGTLAMARTQDPDSNGSQFFIVYQDTQLPDPTGYSVFGRVVEGMDIVDRIAEQGVGADGSIAPAQPISILDVQVEKQG